MTEEQAKRKLTAILSADVKGYSRLMEDNEEATVRTIMAYREVMVAHITRQNGRVLDAKGDNLLAEFSSVVDTVRCAVEIQKELKTRNEELPEHRRMEFRIGINLGDVIQEGDTIYGDGVNIAARLEGLADGGGICISGSAYEQVGKKLPLGYEYLGEQRVKNIENPVRAYKVLMEPEAAGKVIGEERATRGRWVAIAALMAIVFFAGVVALWNFYLRPDVEPASVERMAFPLPDKPSIAVLPFKNLSRDQEQEYLADGITENIITALSKTPKMFVIARNSSFTYKGKPVWIPTVGRELGVRYVLEGSVRKAGDKVRVTAQLIDAQTNQHLWAERYDRDLKDIFAVQDEITKKITTAMQVELTEGEQARIYGKGTDNLEAYLKLLQGRQYLEILNRENIVLAQQVLGEAIALDPGYGEAYTFLAAAHFLEVFLGFSKSPRKSLADAIDLAQKAIALDNSEANPHSILGLILAMKGEYEKGIAEGERAVWLNPNSADAHARLGITLNFSGRWGRMPLHLLSRPYASTLSLQCITYSP